MKRFEWADAKSVEQAITLLDDGAQLKAGGVDLIDLMKENVAQPKRVVNIRNVDGLDSIERDDKGGVRIGALVTLATLDSDEQIRRDFTALADAAGHAATPQVRNMATIGGNLLQRPRCWYFRNEHFPCRKKGGEICYAIDGENQYHAIFDNSTCAIVHPSAAGVALVAMNASIELVGGDGARTVRLEEFFTPPEVDVRRENSLRENEVLTQIQIPALPAGARSAYIKQGEKESFDWPVAEVAVVLSRDGEVCREVSIVLGAAAPVPRRAREAEDALRGKRVDATTARDAARAALRGATPLAMNHYKLPIFEAIITRTILAAAGEVESA